MRLIRALKKQSVDRTPIWLMRQAGRYLPEYRKVREQAGSFNVLCKTPELAAEVTLQPLRRFALDAAIIFSDILVVPDAMGLGLYMSPGEGPCFESPIVDLKQIEDLPIIDPEIELAYVMQAISLVTKDLGSKLPLIGFAGSPWTVATYMVEGKSSKNFNLIKKMLYQHPQYLHKLLQKLTDNTTTYLQAQVKAGVKVLMLFDTWGGVLSNEHFMQFSLNYMQSIVASIKSSHPEIPIILFCKDAGRSLGQLSKTGADALGLDWLVDIKDAINLTKGEVALQGNLEPSALYGDEKLIANKVADILQSIKGYSHIFNLGHGISPDVEPEKVGFLVDEVIRQSLELNNGFNDNS